jgi:hypothetical protein
MSNQFCKVADAAIGEAVVEVLGEKFHFSGHGVTMEDRFKILFPNDVEQARTADHLSAVLGVEVPDVMLSGARAILAAYVAPDGSDSKPDIADIVRMGLNHIGSFTQLDMAASQVLGLTTPTKTAGGIADWGQVYSLLRKAHKKGGDPNLVEEAQKLIKQAALIAKAALQGAGENPEPLDADTEPTLEALRGNSGAVS